MTEGFCNDNGSAPWPPSGYLCIVKVFPGIYPPPQATHSSWGVVVLKNGKKQPVLSGVVSGRSCQKAALQGIVAALQAANLNACPDNVTIDAHDLSSISIMTWEKLKQWATTGKKGNGQPPKNLKLWKALYDCLLPCIKKGKDVQFGLPFLIPKRKPGRSKYGTPLPPKQVTEAREYRADARAAAQTHYRNNVGTVQKVGGRKKGTKNKR